jgi:hypothetical protein
MADIQSQPSSPPGRTVTALSVGQACSGITDGTAGADGQSDTVVAWLELPEAIKAGILATRGVPPEDFKPSDPRDVTASAAKGSPFINEPFSLPSPYGSQNSASDTRALNGGRRAEFRPPTDPDLAALVNAWPDLPEAVRAGIVAMTSAATGTKPC